MKANIIVLISGLFLTFNAFAGGNIALHVKVAGIKASNKATNHADYQALELTGEVTRSDAAVVGMPDILPERVSILFKSDEAADKYLASFCLKAASKAKHANETVRIDIFMQEPNELPSLTEGGMSDNRFNSFVVRTDDPKITNVSCSVGK